MSLDRMSYLTLKEGFNLLPHKYRTALPPNQPNSMGLVWGIVSNAFKGIKCTFASLYLYLWNRQRSVDNWTRAKIYFSFTVLSLQAMLNYQATTMQLLFIAAKA